MRRLTVMRATWLGLGGCVLAGVWGLVSLGRDVAAGVGILGLTLAIGGILWLLGSLALDSARDD